MKKNPSQGKTASILIIGNEILSGKVHDTNSFYLAKELRRLGVEVMRISVVPDDVAVIGKEAFELSRKFDYVFTTGGVGPTHDDVTIRGIAKGFRLKTVRHPLIEKMLRERYDRLLNRALLKMAETPEGAEVIFHEDMRFPLVRLKNIYIFPGIPEYLKNKFPFIRDRFVSAPFFMRRVFLNAHESEIAETLDRVVKGHKKVDIGSYPVLGDARHRIIVTVESRSEKALDRAFRELVRGLPGKTIVRKE